MHVQKNLCARTFIRWQGGGSVWLANNQTLVFTDSVSKFVRVLLLERAYYEVSTPSLVNNYVCTLPTPFSPLFYDISLIFSLCLQVGARVMAIIRSAEVRLFLICGGTSVNLTFSFFFVRRKQPHALQLNPPISALHPAITTCNGMEVVRIYFFFFANFSSFYFSKEEERSHRQHLSGAEVH